MNRDEGEPPLPNLSPQTDGEVLDTIVPWRLDRAEEGESCRWLCVDGRWVSVSLGHGEEIGSVVVKTSAGAREAVDSYEGALELAKRWRTW